MKVSIITIVFNDKQNIEKTILSVLKQTFVDYEYIIIDGASSDGTLEIINKYKNIINKIISEKDEGIYNAMNKAVTFSTGEWIIFMNSGDIFYNNYILDYIFNNTKIIGELIYGDHEIRYAQGYSRIKKSGLIKNIWKGMVFSHQSLLCKTQILKDMPFEENNKIIADYIFILNNFLKGIEFQKIEIVISSVSSGGLSDRKRYLSIIERWQYIHKFNNTIYINLYYIYLLADMFLRLIIKRILPEIFIKKIILSKN